MALDWTEFAGKPVYRVISSRLHKRFGLRIIDHIDSMSSVGVRNGIGIKFVAKDPQALYRFFKGDSEFAHDDRLHFCDEMAAMATRGEGFREIGVPSLHCQISSSVCNIHLDSFGFVARGPDGQKYYNPDLIQHIIDELGWAAFVEWVETKNKTTGAFLARMHPTLPNSRNRYDLSINPGKRNPLTVGGRFDLVEKDTWRLSIEAKVDSEGEWSAGVNIASVPF